MEIIVNMENENLGSSLVKKLSQQTGLNPTLTLGLESFYNLMKSKFSEQVIAVFLVASFKELETMTDQRKSMGDARSIIILSDDDQSHVVKALSLQPRFLTTADNEFDDVCNVINKITSIKELELL